MEVFRMIILALATLVTVVAAGLNFTIPSNFNPDVTYFQNNPDAVLNLFGFNNLGATLEEEQEEEEVVEVTCGGSSSISHTLWQSSHYPNLTALPSLCSLHLTPPPNTCAIKVNFDDLVFTPEFSFLDIKCPDVISNFKMSHAVGISLPLCTDLTGLEGIVEVDPEDDTPHVLLLTFIEKSDFKFKIRTTAVSCDKLNTYKSPNICGIKNEVQKTRNGKDYSASSQEPLNPREALDETTSGGVDEDDTLSTRSKTMRNKNNNGGPPPVTKKELIKMLKQRKDIFSQALVKAVQRNILKASTQHTRVLGSEAGIGEWPWMVVVERKNEQLPTGLSLPVSSCSGALVDGSHVLTTISCVLFFTGLFATRVSGLRVLVGEHNLTTPDETTTLNISVSKVTFPITYSPFILKDDLAVIELAESVEFSNNIRPACLPVEYNVFNGDSSIVSGWGSNSAGQVVNSLQSMTVQFSNETICNTTIHTMLQLVNILNTNNAPVDIILEDYICTEMAVCALDFGVPLMRRDQTGAYFIVGVAAPVNVCGVDLTSVFTKIKPNSTFLNVALS